MDTMQEVPPRKPAAKHSDEKVASQAPAAGGHDGQEEEAVIPKDLPRPGWLTIIAMFIILVVLLAGLFVVGWLPHHEAEMQAKGDANEAKSDVPIVTVALPTVAKSTSDLVLPCDVLANRDTAIFPRTNGYLKARYVDIQDHVKAGQLLAEIDTPEVDAQLAQAKVMDYETRKHLERVTNDYDLAKRTLDRYHSLQGTVTTQEVEDKENALAQATSAVAEAKAQIDAQKKATERLEVMVGFEKVTAPYDGTITARNFDVGALLSSSDTSGSKEMFHLAETATVRVFVNVPQIYASKVKIGDAAYLTANDVEFRGTVARSSESINPNTRTMLYELSFPNPSEKIFPGMYGMARLEVHQDHPGLMIPTNALRFDANGTQVAVVTDGKVHFQTVKPGRDMGTELEIIDGLTPESRVVLNPGESLSEGGAVKVVGGEEAVAVKKGDVKKASTE